MDGAVWHIDDVISVMFGQVSIGCTCVYDRLLPEDVEYVTVKFSFAKMSTISEQSQPHMTVTDDTRAKQRWDRPFFAFKHFPIS